MKRFLKLIKYNRAKSGLCGLIRRAYQQSRLLLAAILKLPLYLKLPLLAVILILGTFIGVQYNNYRHEQLYTISTSSRQLLSASSVDTSKIKVQANTISYNESDQKPTKEKQVTIAGPADSTGKTGYKATIKNEFAAGLSFGDAHSELNFKMAPQFDAQEGVYQDGQIMFPVSTSTKIVQTFKKNGVKEDIILTKSPGQTASWQWKLGLGDKLEAKLQPDGSVGVFAANPSLYGDIQINDARSQALIDKARTTDKNYQIFTIPAPYIKNAAGKTLGDDVSFKLNGDILTLEASNLDNQSYPISIDPSVVITTTADFATGTDDGTIEYATANQISRGAITLGSVGATTSQATAFTGAREHHSSVTYNGFVYIIGGWTTAEQNDILFSSVGAGGALTCPSGFTCSTGVFTQQTAAFTTARYGHTSVVYNGYLYIIGGHDASAGLNDIIRCPLNANGSVGTCVQQTNIFTTARWYHQSVVYNGFLYIIDASGVGGDNDIIHCPINSDGSVGTCVQQTGIIPTEREQFGAAAYNGYLYITGGTNGTLQNDIIHCPLNTDGSIGTCVTEAAAFTTARFGHTTVASDGYIFIIGGCTAGGCTGFASDIQHCPIFSDGSVGTCVQEAAAFTTARKGHSSVVYGNYVYIIGGCSAGNCTTRLQDVQRLPFDAGTPTGQGTVGATTQQATAFTTARYAHTSVAYNGYLYVIGGTNGGSNFSDIQFAAINSNGSLSCPSGYTCSTGVFAVNTTGFTTTRQRHTSVVYNGYLYVIGGTDGVSAYYDDIQHCPINADGSVGTCVQQTAAFTTARFSHTSVVYNGYLYVIGGCSAPTCSVFQNDVQYTWLDPSTGASCLPSNHATCTGTVFAQQTNVFNTARVYHTSVVNNGHLYIIGGYDGTNTYRDDIIHCPINSDGSVGTCVQQTAAFTTGRRFHTSVVYNGYLYISGGCSAGGCTGFLNDVIHCPLNTDGSVGTCVTESAAFTTARQALSSTTYNGYMYLTGGNSGSAQNDAQRLPFESIPQAAHYERVLDIGKTADSIDSIQYNGTVKCGAEIQYATAGSDGVFGTTTTLWPDALTGTTYTISGQTTKRYVRIVVTLTDQSCGGNSVVTDFTVNYTLVSPDPPTLSAPSSGAISQSITPVFQLKTTDAADTYARYKIEVYQSNCSTLVRTIDQTGSQTGWSGQDAQTSTAYVVGTTLGASTLASHTYQAAALSYNTTYCWKVAAIDPGGSNTFSAYSATQLFTTNQTPSAPTLSQPTAAQTGVSTLPELRLYSTDPDPDYLRYKIEVCSTSNCSVVVRTIDQTSSQTGWASQSQQGATAYSSGQSAVHTYQTTALSANTQYWWRAYAIDPGGVNAWSSASGIGTFTTQTSATLPTVSIKGNVNIGGNVVIKP